MIRILPFLSLMLVAASSYALENPPEPPEPTVSVWWVALFAVLFVGLCAWYVWLTVRNERTAKSEGGSTPPPAV